MPMFEHILIPLDFTEPNDSALQVAGSLARERGSRVSLLHVVESLEDGDDAELTEFYGQLEQRAREKLRQMREVLVASGVTTETVVTVSRRAEEIVRFAAEYEVDLIVMSSHHLDPDNLRRPWPTVSHRVALTSPIPVLLVR